MRHVGHAPSAATDSGTSSNHPPRGFWITATTLGLFVACAAVPTPLYSVYAQRFDFSAGTLTVIFGLFALPVLTTLVAFGGLSDAVGRKPVLYAASGVLLAGQVTFLFADGTVMLLIARFLQGIAVGLVTAAAPAALLDQEPPRHPGRAALVIVTVSMGGQAAGAFASGALVQYAPDPRQLVYLISIAAVLALVVAVLIGSDETVTHRHRFHVDLRLALPRGSHRSTFLAAVPALIATFALSSLYLSLGPGIAAALSHSTNLLAAAAAPGTLLLIGTAAAFAARAWPASRRMGAGCAVLILGSGLTIAALATRNAPAFYAGTAVAGLGFGVAFAGSLRTLTDLADADNRAAWTGTVYLIAYLSFSVPAIIAGLVSARAGLLPTSIGFSAAVAALAATALLLTRRGVTRTST